MAYIGQTSIKSVGHMDHAIAYVANPKKALDLQKEELQEAIRHVAATDTQIGERATFLNCSPNHTATEFEMLRKSHHQDKGVIAHHYYQSFSPDDPVTPEIAHKIGVELASKIFAGYQVVVTTHTDRNHLHNHILVNSCHIETGAKWHSNKTTLRAVRAESDKLCRRYGMSVIQSDSTHKAIDKTTYQMALQGKSWKVQLCNDLDEAVKQCRSKSDFEKFFHERGYECRYTASHITLKKNGEKKGVRVDTLAKQFGEQYTKANLEKAMGYSFDEVELRDMPAQRNNAKRAEPKSNHERLTERTFAQRSSDPIPNRRPKGWYQQYTPPAKRQLNRFPLNHLCKGNSLIRTTLGILAFCDRMRYRRNGKSRTAVYQFKISQPLTKPSTSRIHYGTIDYKKLTSMSGDNYSVTVNAEHILKLANRPLLYSALIDRERGTATITVKACDKEYLAQILGMSEIQKKLDEQSKRNQNRAAFAALRKKAEGSGQDLKFLKVTAEQLAVLQDNCQDISYMEKDSGITITFLAEDESLIRSLISDKKEKKTETEYQRNNRIYAELKKEAALQGVKLHYKANITMEQIKAASAAGLKLAYFKNPKTPGLFKIAYSNQDEKNLRNILFPDVNNDGIDDRLQHRNENVRK